MERKQYTMVFYTTIEKFQRIIPKNHLPKFKRGYVFGFTNFTDIHRKKIKTIINLPDIFWSLGRRYREPTIINKCVRAISHEFLHGEILQQINKPHPEWIVQKMNDSEEENGTV